MAEMNDVFARREVCVGRRARRGVYAERVGSSATGDQVIAIGGIRPEDVPAVMDTGAHGVAVLSAVTCDPDPAAAAHRFAQALMPYRQEGQ